MKFMKKMFLEDKNRKFRVCRDAKSRKTWSSTTWCQQYGRKKV